MLSLLVQTASLAPWVSSRLLPGVALAAGASLVVLATVQQAVGKMLHNMLSFPPFNQRHT